MSNIFKKGTFMSNACPLNFKQVDSNTSRFSALLVALLVLVYLVTHNIFILLFLAIDFIVKLFINKKISLIMLFAEFLKNSFNIEDSLVDGGAKRLAAFLGLFFVFLLIGTHYLLPWEITLVFATIFLCCSLLDVFFDYCIGCKIYFIIKKIYPNFMNRL